MGAANVWSCIQSYRKDKAKEILKAYGTDAAIIMTLGNYPLKDSYHGHQSGGEGTNSGADQNLDAAITFLENNKPAMPFVPPKSKGENKELKAANQKSNQAVTTFINEATNLGDLTRQLDELSPGWKNNRILWDCYCVKYRLKKGKNPTKN